MSTVAIITDTHFGARGDLPALQVNMRRFYDDVFFPTLDQHGVKTILHAGDYTDRRKYVNYNTARFVHDAYRTPIAERDIHEIVILGNHDCYFKHTNEVNSVEELYRHIDGKEVTIIKHPCELEVDGNEMLMLPWICDANRDDSMRLIEDSRAALVLAHLELVGFQQYKGHPASSGMMPDVFDKFKLVMTGHYHHKSTSGPVHYLGAPYPMIWSDYNDPRGFHLFDTETHELTFVSNPYSIFIRLVYDDEGKKFDYIEQLVQQISETSSPYRDSYVKIVIKTKTQPYWFELLMDALYKVNALDVVIVDDIIVNDDDSESVKPDGELKTIDTRTLIHDYVNGLNISCDKQELTNYLDTLYIRAVEATREGTV